MADWLTNRSFAVMTRQSAGIMSPADSITISHGPIASLKWGPMTMGFALPAAGLPQGIAAGGRVHFEIQETTSGEYRITNITPDDPEHVTPMIERMQDDAQGRQP